jgi:EmrB/QacA subfamily drug resistance transporter
MAETNKTDRRWWALMVLCLGTLMIVLDTTIVNVALPSIKKDLGFSEVSLAWVVNAYMLTFGGFLLLGGRMGDLFGQRKIFLVGIALFTLASLGCGFAHTQSFLIAMRSVQGVGAAIISAVALSLVMNLFTEPVERAKAMGVYGFVASGGGSIGVLLGGVLTGSFNWHWIFLINIPIGILVFILSILLLPKATGQGTLKHLDIAGAVTVTMSLLLAVFGIVNGNQAGWASVSTLGTLGASVATMLLFLFIEAKVPFPLIPLSLLRLRNVAIANIVGVLWSGGMFAWFFLSALYMQLVLHYTPLQVGLSFLPSNIIMAVFSLGLSAKIVLKMGIRASLTVGLFFVSMGLFLFVRAPVDGTFLRDILPNMVLLGIGAGIAFNPMLLAAMKDVREGDSGLASGLVNTSFMMGGALGLAVLASLAASRTESLLHTGLTQEASLVGGYQAAFFVGTIFALLAALAAGLYLRTAQSTQKNA